MMENTSISKAQMLEAAQQQSELRDIVQQVVYDCAPRTMSLSRADQMADSIAYQIASGTLMNFVISKPDGTGVN